MRVPGFLILALILSAVPSVARGGGSYSSRSSGSRHSARVSGGTRPSRGSCAGCARTSSGKIKRSAAAKRTFERSHPCPSTGKTSGPCKGYVVDHIVPLKRGGADSPENMQWQTFEAAKAKDKTE